MKRLKDYRRAAKLTQQQLVEATGLAIGTISNLETGVQRNPRYETMLRIAKVLGPRLGIDPEALLPDLYRALRTQPAASPDEEG